MPVLDFKMPALGEAKGGGIGPPLSQKARSTLPTNIYIIVGLARKLFIKIIIEKFSLFRIQMVHCEKYY